MVGGLVALALAATVPGAAPLAGAARSAVGGTLALGAQLISDRSLDSEIAELRSQLKRLSTKFIMVVDDLDRLRPDELLQILTLIKTFGNLPNVIHLLAYDRRILDAALPPAAGAAGERVPTYLEKIVQMELALPPPGRARLFRLAVERLTAIFGPEPEMGPEDWSAVVRVAFDHYVRSPRDVMRLANALSVVWPAVASEVYLPDLMAVEVLRLFKPAAHDRIRASGPFLTGTALLWNKEDAAAAAKVIADAVPDARRDDVLELLARMFPAARETLAPRAFADSSDAPEEAGRRIGTSAGFDAYFAFSGAPDEIPVSELRELAARLDDEATVRRALADAMGRRRSDGLSLAAPLLEELQTIVRRRDTVGSGLLRALLALGDDLMSLADYEAGFFVTTNVARLRRLMLDAARRMLPGSRAAEIGEAILAPDAGPHTAAFLVALLGADHWIVLPRPDRDREEPILDAAEAEALASAFAARVAERRDAIRPSRSMELLPRVWEHASGPEEPRAWVAARLGDSRGAVDLAFSVMTHVESSARPYRYRAVRGVPHDIFDLGAMTAALEGHLAAGAVTKEDEGDVRRFVREARRILARADGEGASGSDQGDDEDDA